MERPEYQSRPEIRNLQSFPSFQAIEATPRGPLEKFLSYFADVRAGEGPGVLLMTLNVFLLLFAYYLLKTVREALILSEGGAAVKAYSSAGQAALLMILVPLYGLVASRVKRIVLVSGLGVFFAMNLVVFSILGTAGAREGVVFYIWVGIFNVFVISQFWAFANDIYTESQGKRLFAMIGIGSSLGAWLGAQAASEMVRRLGLSPYELQLIAAGLLVVCAGIMFAVNRMQVRQSVPEMAALADQKLGTEDGFVLIWRSPYLRWIAILTVLLNIVNSSGEFLLGSVVSEEARNLFPGDETAQKQYIGGFYGSFFAGVNLLEFLLQSFAVSRILQFAGVRRALYILPSIALFSYTVLAFVPVLAIVRIAKTLENATDYSIQNTLRQALFLPTSREAKYKAKAAVDTFFMRTGDVIQAGIVRVGVELQMATAGFAWLNVAFTLGWLWIAARLDREHRRLSF